MTFDRFLFFLGYPTPFPGAAWVRINYLAGFVAFYGHDGRVQGLPRIPFPRIFRPIVAFFRMLAVCIAFQPDIVVISVPTGGPALGAWFAAKLSHRRIIMDYRDEWEAIYPPSLQELTFGLYRRSLGTMTVTDPLAENLRRHGILNPIVVANGVETGIFKPGDKAKARTSLGLPQDAFIIGYVGNLQFYRFDIVQRAVNDLQPGVLFALMGDGIEKHALEGMPDVALVPPSFDKGEIARFLQACDLGIVPYDDNPLWDHAFPAKAYEYAGCGLPIVATVGEESLLARTFQANKMGITCPPVDAWALADAIDFLRGHPEILISMSKNARAWALNHDRRQAAGIMLNLLDSIMGRGPGQLPIPTIRRRRD